MSFWEGFFNLNIWFVQIYLAISLIGILLILWELSNRKLRIDRNGISLDRLREKKSFRIKLWEAKQRNRRKEDKISPVEAVKKG